MSKTTASARLSSEAMVAETFRKLWTRTQVHLAARLDPLSEDIAKIILPLLPRLNGVRVLEAGSGTGRISALFAEQGYEVTLLDTSNEALEISREVFRIRQCRFQAIQGSIFHIPVASEYFDVVWNAGVLEHFRFPEQLRAVHELARVLKLGGHLVTFNPSARGWIYRAGKFIAERRGKWTVGEEFPVTTLREHCERLGLRLVSEREVAPEHQFTFFGRLGDPLRALCAKSPSAQAATLRMFGGYLKLSVIQRVQSPPATPV